MPPARMRRRLAVGPPHPAIRLRPAPALEPPFDDELPPQRADQRAEQLALDLHTSPPETSGSPSGQPGGASAGRPARASAESWQATRRFVGICLEVLNGYRPAGHLRPLTSPAHAGRVIEQLGLARERAAVLTRRSARPDRPDRPDPTGRPAAPAAPSGPARTGSRRREPVRLGTLQVCEPRCGVAEAVAVLHLGGRAWALAVRLERRRGRWLCVAARTV